MIYTEVRYNERDLTHEFIIWCTITQVHVAHKTFQTSSDMLEAVADHMWPRFHRALKEHYANQTNHSQTGDNSSADGAQAGQRVCAMREPLHQEGRPSSRPLPQNGNSPCSVTPILQSSRGETTVTSLNGARGGIT